MSVYRNIPKHRYIGCLHEIVIQIFKINTVFWLDEEIGYTLKSCQRSNIFNNSVQEQQSN